MSIDAKKTVVRPTDFSESKNDASAEMTDDEKNRYGSCTNP